MKKAYLSFFTSLACICVLLHSCSKDEYKPYNNPYFHIHVDNKDTVSVRYNRKDEVAYKVYLSAELQYTGITLDYEVLAGNGLQEGKDFIVKTPGSSLSFPPGLFERAITIAWLENPVDPTKNNTVIIRLKDNSKHFTVGLPGPDNRQRQLVIVKTN